MRTAALVLVLMGALGLTGTGQAAAAAPLPARDLSPLAQIYGLPPATGAAVPPRGQTELQLTSSLVGNFTRDQHAGEQIFLDGESYRFAISLRHGLGQGLEIGAEIPYVFYRGGFLDDFIIGWHDVFGLPQKERDEFPRDRLLITYSENGDERLRLDAGTEGLGDIRLTGGWRLLETSAGSAALRASLKLPTGDSGRLLGSGSTDLALWLSGERGAFAGVPRLTLFGRGGALVLTRGDILADRQHRLVGFGTLGGAWQLLPRLALKIQADGHSPFHTSDLPQFDPSLLLTLGGSLAWGGTIVDLAVSEDVILDAAPDLTVLLAVRRAF